MLEINAIHYIYIQEFIVFHGDAELIGAVSFNRFNKNVRGFANWHRRASLRGAQHLIFCAGSR